MSFILPTLRDIDKDTKYIVFGYINQIENVYNFEKIPSLICFICLAYYYNNPEYFESAGDNIIISNNKQMITKTIHNDFSNTTLMNQWIESNSKCIVKWIFHIKKTKDYSTIF